MESFRNLGCKPNVIYADQEPSWSGSYAQPFFKDEDMFSITTLTHAGVLERAIRAIKDMLYTRLEHDSKRPWYGELLQHVVFVYS